jgi:uncharacterized protein (DUF362 family)
MMGSTNGDLQGITKYLETDITLYPTEAPFNPPEIYPEYDGDVFDEHNTVYPAVRELLYSLGMDTERFGTKNWNPLGEIIKPGDNVVIKPNFVSEPRSDKTSYEAVITHPSVIRPLIDYSLIALQGKGSLVVADAPQTDSDIEKIKNFTKIDEIIKYVNLNNNIKVKFLDLRYEHAICKDGVICQREIIKGDSKGYTVVDLGNQSQFSLVEQHLNKIYGADYDYDELRKHHCGGKHEYCISNTILDADVIINVPKLKTHKKAGITVCLKNLVGINVNKNYLPHYRFGSTTKGGDEYLGDTINKGFESKVVQICFRFIAKYNLEGKSIIPVIGKLYKSLNQKNIFHVNSGNWYGNDTIWRTIVDLNNILLYADKKGSLQKSMQRKYLAIVDGIIAGEGEGPMTPTPKICGVLIGGFDPVLVDKLSAEIMGFDWKRIPQIYNGAQILNSEKKSEFAKTDYNIKNFKFLPPSGWEGYIELKINKTE